MKRELNFLTLRELNFLTLREGIKIKLDKKWDLVLTLRELKFLTLREGIKKIRQKVGLGPNFEGA